MISAGVYVNGITVPVKKMPVELDHLAFSADVTSLGGRVVRLEARTEFVHDWGYKETTIRLRNHFCLGSFEAEIRVEGDDPASVIDVYDYIEGVDESDVKLYGQRSTSVQGVSNSSGELGFARVSVAANSLIWPGSGIHFSWYRSGVLE